MLGYDKLGFSMIEEEEFMFEERGNVVFEVCWSYCRTIWEGFVIVVVLSIGEGRVIA
jgi:hypothetical protein